MLLGFELTRYLTSIEDKKTSVINLTLIGGLAIGFGVLWGLSSSQLINRCGHLHTLSTRRVLLVYYWQHLFG